MEKEIIVPEIIGPDKATEVRNVMRDTLCLMLGISIDSDDEKLLEKAKEFGGKLL